MADTVKHTPGPWLNAGRGAGAHIHADKGEIAWLRSYMGIPDEEIDANAHLVAAAPDLLEALRDFASMKCETAGVEDLEGGCCRTCRARAAIAKAEGRS